MKKFYLLSLPMLLASLAGAASGDTPPAAAPGFDFAKVMAQADALIKAGGEGLRYDQAVGQFVQANLVPVIQTCWKTTPNPSKQTFDIVAMLGQTGAVNQGLIHPRTNIAACLAPAVTAAKFPAPPHADYPMHIHWVFKQ